MPQVPTARGIKIRSAADAHLLFYAVHLQRLPMIQRRLDATERQEVKSGAVFIWEERSAAATGNDVKEEGGSSAGVISGIERWTDGLKWGPSRVRDDFLFYQEKDPNDRDTPITPPNPTQAYRPPHGPSRTQGHRHQERLVKQTYSVHYYPQVMEGKPPVEPARKWHLTAYHSPSTIERLADISSVPELQDITPPEGLFKKARVGKKRDNPPGHPSSAVHPPLSNPALSSTTNDIKAAPSSDFPKPSVATNANGSGINGVSYSGGPTVAYGGSAVGVQHGSNMMGGFGVLDNGVADAPPPSGAQHHHSGSYGVHGRSDSVHEIGSQVQESSSPHQRYTQSTTQGYPPRMQDTYVQQQASYPRGPTHSHGGSVGYSDNYSGYGANYAYTRDRPYTPASQLAPIGGTQDSYDPFRPPSSHQPHHSYEGSQSAHPASVPQPPTNAVLPHAPHQRSQSHCYPNGHSGTPSVHHIRQQSHSFSTPIPSQVPPHGHQRSFSASSDMTTTTSQVHGIRSPGSGAIRTRRGMPIGPVDETPRSEAGSMSTSPPNDGAGRGHYSPYNRPSNAPPPRSHPAFAPPPNTERPGSSHFSDYGRGQFPSATHPYQPPGVPIAHSRSHSLPHHYTTPAIPTPPIPPGLYPTSGSSQSTQYSGGNPQFRQVDYSTPLSQSTWSHAALPPPVAPPVTSDGSFSYTAGAFPTPPTPQPVTHPTQTLEFPHPTDPHNPSTMTPHPNPDSSPPITQFRPAPTSAGITGGGLDLGNGYSRGGIENGGPLDARVASGVTFREGRPASITPTLDTSIGGSSSGPTSASSKLVPLTPSAHQGRDPEDERLLGLISRSASGKGSGDAGSVVSASGVLVQGDEGEKVDE